jgi:hypothetical protein
VENRAAISKRDKSLSSVHASSETNGNEAEGIQMGGLSSGRHSGVRQTAVEIDDVQEGHAQAQKGMILPFQPLALTFHNVNYYVDMPAVSVLSHTECFQMCGR